MNETAETATEAVVARGTIEVQNVVGAGDLGRELDLTAVATDLSETEYDPETMPGLLYRPPVAEATVFVFGSGKVTVMGAATSEGVRRAFEQCVTALRDLGVPALEPSEMTIENVVASADIGGRLNLSAVAVGLGLEQCEYEPEQFPGLVYRLGTEDAVVLLFGSGKAVVVGATDCSTIERTVETVATRLADLGLLD